MKLILLVSLLFSLNTYSKVLGSGQFFAKEGDSLSFIKKQVLHEAFLDVIRKEALRLGLNWQEFMKSYEESFAEYYTPIKEEKIKKWENNKDKEKFLRQNELALKRRFQNLDKVITSYSIQKLSRSVQNPKLRVIKIEAEVDPKMLYQIYNRLVVSKDAGSKYLTTLYILPEFELVNCSFVDLGVKKRSDLTGVIKDYWFNWLQENQLPHVKNISFVEKGEEDYLSKNRSAGVMTLKIVIEKKSALDNSLFSLSGNLLVVDAITDNVIYSQTFAETTRKISDQEMPKINSVLANHIYRMPLADFNSLKKVFQTHTVPLSVADIRVVNYQNLDQVLTFMNTLTNRGLRLGVKTKLDRFGSGYADVRVFYNGEGQLLRNLLDGVKTLKSGSKVKLVKRDNPYQVSF